MTRNSKKMKKVTKELDSIASTLESKGLVKLATRLDVVSNTLEQRERGLFPKKSFTKDDIIRENYTFNPKFHVVNSAIVHRNDVVLPSGEEYTVITSVTPSVSPEGLVEVRVDFSTVEKTDHSDKNIRDIDELGDHSQATEIKQYIKDTILSFEQQGQELWAKAFKNIFEKLGNSFDDIEDFYEKNIQAYEKDTPEIKKLGDKIREVSENFSVYNSKTLNKEGLSTKVLSSVVLSIVESLRNIKTRLTGPGKKRNDLKLHSFLIGAKKDFDGDSRRQTIYKNLFKKFSSMITNERYTIKETRASDGDLESHYQYNKPIPFKDLSL